MEKTYLYSHLEDDWAGADESIEEVAQRILDDMTEKEKSEVTSVTIYKGEKVKQEFQHFLNVNVLMESMQDSANDLGIEETEGYLENVTKQEKDELEAIIIDWAEKNNIRPRWHMIENIESVDFKIPNDWNA